ncbi:MAG: DNA translocase FtsK, partial [Deltaproteobacteria bacterium]|nr:DNA translocase FtsK [Deltaproteobacteria bacterium]
MASSDFRQIRSSRYRSPFMTTIDGNKLGREITAVVLFFLAAFMSLSLFSYSVQDPTFGTAYHGGGIRNLAGPMGSYASGFLVELFGMAAWIWPVLTLYVGLCLMFSLFRFAWWRWLGIAMLVAVTLSLLEREILVGKSVLEMSGGGYLGRSMHSWLVGMFGIEGSMLVEGLFLVLGCQLALGLSWSGLGSTMRRCLGGLWAWLFRLWGNIFFRSDGVESEITIEDRKQTENPSQKQVDSPANRHRPIQAKTSPIPVQIDMEADRPGVELLVPVPASQPQPEPTVLDSLAKKLSECLVNFGIQGEVQHILPGPVVTMFEFKPAPGIKISRIAGLNNDLALALMSRSVRIVAPLPGRDTVGVEIPNEKRQTVYLREILGSEQFTKSRWVIPLALGKDIQGKPVVADLARMPHMLVAGATGAGKSVCLNTLILSLLYTFGPEEAKFLLIDPKRIELAVYSDLPHLVHPVVTDMNLAKNALDWVVHEMEGRYSAMAEAGVRNIADYNRRVREAMANLDEEEQSENLPRPLPYLVLIIDELADLMLTAAKDVEVSIVRLAQLARAAGIHLILATQRPSVDVVTGLIKANFPARIAFQVSSKHDSRTILDAVGAEYLLGQGDMLFKRSGGDVTRVHGSFVSDGEIEAVVGFWKAKGKPDYAVNFEDWSSGRESDLGGEGGNGNDVPDDPVYNQAVEFVMDQGKASISLIQRRFRIG